MAVGHVESLFRYPVKSLLGESLTVGAFDERGMRGDRCLAFVDRTSGKVASPKQPKLWSALLRARAELGEADAPDQVRVHFPDGRTFGARDAALEEAMSTFLGRSVRLVDAPPEAATIERVTPEGEDTAGTVVELPVAGAAPSGTLFDYAPVHLVSTASLRALEQHHLDGRRSDVLRFRPNIVIAMDDLEGFIESAWSDRTIELGEARLRILSATPRCAVPTLAQGDTITADTQLIRTLGKFNRVFVPGFGDLSCLGAYAAVTTPGTVRLGDRVSLV